MTTRGNTFGTNERPGRSDAVDAVASEWVVRRRAGLDESGERELVAWLESDPMHAEAFSRLGAMAEVLQRAQRTGAASEIMVRVAIRARRRRARGRALAVLGCTLMLAGGLWLAPRSAAPPASPTMAYTAEPVRRLPDGSTVEIKRGADISIAFDAAFRRVELLRGEAHFRVEKDAGRPFIVSAGGIEVRAIGTEFSVRLDPIEVEVLVTEGQVGVDDGVRRESLLPRAERGEVATLVAGQKAVVDRGNGPAGGPPPVHIVHLEPAEIKARLAWRGPRLEFDGAALAEAVAQFNRSNRIQILIIGNALQRERVSGAFVPDDVETFARLMAASFDLEMERSSEHQIVLRQK